MYLSYSWLDDILTLSIDFLRKDNPRQAFFASFSRKALQCVSETGSNGPKIMLTGSIVSRPYILDIPSQTSYGD